MLLFSFVFAYGFLLSGDSIKIEYPLSDPRNPACACHKYQKRAEKEYKRSLKNENTGTAFNQKAVMPVSAVQHPVAIKQRKLFFGRSVQKTKQLKQQKSKARKNKKQSRKSSRANRCYKW